MELWNVVPAPNVPLLALAVVVPELAPWGVVACAAIFALAVLSRPGRTRSAALAACAVAAVCALGPIVQLPAAIAAAEGEMARTAPLSSAAATGRPFDLVTSFAGFGALPPVRVTRDIPVAVRDGKRLVLDLYRPLSPGPHAAVVAIYGGAWQFGDRAQSAGIARALCTQDYAVFAIEYRHAPRYHFPAQLADVRAALATIGRNARAWNVDPARIALFGRSAGAQLALLAAYAPVPRPLSVRAVVGYYTPVDLVRGYAEPPRPDPADVRAILRAYLGGTPTGERAAYRAASPVTHVRHGLPPTLLISGGRDELVPLAFQYELRDALRASGVPVAALDLPWSNHAFDTLPSGLGGQFARHYTARFLAAYL